MRLPLDWDSNALKEMHLDAVRERQPANENQRRLADYVGDQAAGDKWELWTSSGHDHDAGEGGWHYVEYGLDGDLETIRALRTAYGDDKLRTSLDGKRLEWGSPFVAVLYHMKNIKPGEHKPYSTGNRAKLVERHWPTEDYIETKNEDGTLNYAAITTALADHEDFGSRAALFRTIQRRDSVHVSTEPTKRGYDIAHGRRSPTRNEAKALRDYAESRDLGHYGDGGVPEELLEKPSRTTFHEYWEMPEIEFDAQDFGDPDADSESEWFPVNIRTGSYGEEVPEQTIKQIHDRIARKVVDTLSPGFYQEKDGERHWQGLDLERWDRAISLERDRPLDRDEYARYRRAWLQNQPEKDPEQVKQVLDRHDVEQFSETAVHWEVIVFYGEDAFTGNGPTSHWWIARGVLDAEDNAQVRAPLQNGAVVTDTKGFL